MFLANLNFSVRSAGVPSFCVTRTPFFPGAQCVIIVAHGLFMIGRWRLFLLPALIRLREIRHKHLQLELAQENPVLLQCRRPF